MLYYIKNKNRKSLISKKYHNVNIITIRGNIYILPFLNKIDVKLDIYTLCSFTALSLSCALYIFVQSSESWEFKTPISPPPPPKRSNCIKRCMYWLNSMGKKNQYLQSLTIALICCIEYSSVFP